MAHGGQASYRQRKSCSVSNRDGASRKGNGSTPQSPLGIFARAIPALRLSGAGEYGEGDYGVTVLELKLINEFTGEE